MQFSYSAEDTDIELLVRAVQDAEAAIKAMEHFEEVCPSASRSSGHKEKKVKAHETMRKPEACKMDTVSKDRLSGGTGHAATHDRPRCYDAQGPTCYTCNKRGHKLNECPNKVAGKAAKVVEDEADNRDELEGLQPHIVHIGIDTNESKVEDSSASDPQDKDLGAGPSVRVCQVVPLEDEAVVCVVTIPRESQGEEPIHNPASCKQAMAMSAGQLVCTPGAQGP